MQSMRRPGIAILVIILGTGYLLGQLKAAGQLLIPTAGGIKPHKCFITIKRREIKIDSNEKIFQKFNEFNSPKTGIIKVNTAEVERICVQEDTILILPKANFHQRYRHLFIPCERVRSVIFLVVEKKNAMIFIVDNPTDITYLGKEVIKLINERCNETNAAFE